MQLLEDAVQWAQKCGLANQVKAAGPERIEVNGAVCGWTVSVQETAPPGRIGTARYNAAGKRSMWTLDGKRMT